MKAIFTAIILVAISALASAADFTPVSVWPKSVCLDGVMYYNPPVAVCVKAGLRLQLAVPSTPTGKKIVKVEWMQDAAAEMCKAIVTYEDIPAPPVIPPVSPEVWTNIISGKLSVWFTTNGSFRLMEMVDKPVKTNAVPK